MLCFQTQDLAVRNGGDEDERVPHVEEAQSPSSATSMEPGSRGTSEVHKTNTAEGKLVVQAQKY